MFYDGEMEIACPDCHGTGYDPLDGGQCDRCDGTGMISVNSDDESMIMQGYVNTNEPEGYDRRWRDSATGEIFYGYDQDDGETNWLSGSGDLVDVTPTPSEDEQEAQDYMNGWI